MNIFLNFKEKQPLKGCIISKTFMLCGVLVISFMGLTVFGQKESTSEVMAKVSGTLNCVNSSVKLIGSSNHKGATFKWKGPGGYFSTAKESVTTIPGSYTLSVIDPESGKTATAEVVVHFDTIPPTDVAADVSGDITCRDTLVTLKGRSSDKGMKYNWAGPMGFSAKKENTVTAVPGFYRLTVTNPSNGCTSVASTHVRKNTEKPKGVSASGMGILTCKVTSLALKGTSSTKNVTYSWTGPDFKAATASANIVSPGDYVLKVTDPVNGCSVVSKMKVKQDIVPPKGLKTTVPDTLTCRKKMVMVKASSAVNSPVYDWEGPNNFSSSENSFTTYTPGKYTVKLTDPNNGCSVKKQVNVLQDTAKPNNITLKSSGTINCKTKKVRLSGNPHIPYLVYDWKGPGNFVSRSITPQVSMPGIYIATITNSHNGCSGKRSVTVSSNTTAPSGITARASDTLKCSVNTVKLMGTSDIKNATFQWSGPNNFSATGQNSKTSSPGKYKLTVTNPLNGCTSTKNAIVIEVKCAE